MGYEQISYDVADRIATITLNRPAQRNGHTPGMAEELGHALGAAGDDDVRVVLLTGAGNDFCVGADLSGGSLDVGGATGQWVEPATRATRPRDQLAKPVIAADEALAAGLVTAVYEPDQVLAQAYELARELIAKTASISTAVIRQPLYRMSALDSPEAAFALDSKLIASCGENPDGCQHPLPRLLAVPDSAEGVRSFLQRRPPEFTGRVSQDQPDLLPWSTP